MMIAKRFGLLPLAAALVFSGAIMPSATFAQSQVEASRQQPEQTPQPETYFVTISINDVDMAGIYRTLAHHELFWIEAQTLQELGINVPADSAFMYRNRAYLPLNSVAGLSYNFNSNQQHLSFECLASCFPSSKLSAAQRHPKPDDTAIGAFLNYDLLAEKSSGNEFIGGLAEVGIFSNHGSGTLTFSGRDLTNDAAITRLETSWTIDLPNKRQRWRFGDSITQHGGWGQAVRFGGIQFGTDFGLQPGFISFPTPTISGGAALPSTAEIFVNGIRRGSVDLDPGAFTIEQPPVITGSGDLLVVVRDLLGRETILSHPFYASRSLLRPNLSEYSIEAGFLRKNFGSTSNDYAEPFIAGSYRKGLSNNFTAGVHTEASSKRAGIGPYIDWQTPFGGIFSSSAALSHKGGKTGSLFQVNFNWETQNFGISASNEWISKNFSRLGDQQFGQEPRMQTSANIGFDVSEDSALSLNYLRVDERQGPTLQIASANFSFQVGDIGSISANVSRSFGEVRDTALFMVFTARLADRTTGSASIDRSGGQWSTSARVSQNAPSDGGLGYRAEATVDGGERAQAGITYNSGKGILALDHSMLNGKHTSRLGLRGGMVLMDGSHFLTNTVNDSFALVKVGGFEGVGVLRDNRPITKTNKSGKALISRLRPYEENRLSINPLDLPLTADIDAITLMPVPRRRSGVIADFPISQTISAMIKIIDDTGKALELGTILRTIEGDAKFHVGFDGAAYVTGLEKPLTLWAQTKNGECFVKINALKPSRYPARLGTLVCSGKKP